MFFFEILEGWQGWQGWYIKAIAKDMVLDVSIIPEDVFTVSKQKLKLSPLKTSII